MKKKYIHNIHDYTVQCQEWHRVFCPGKKWQHKVDQIVNQLWLSSSKNSWPAAPAGVTNKLHDKGWKDNVCHSWCTCQ